MELKLAIVFTVIGGLVLISSPFVFATKEFSSGYEFYYVMGLVAASILSFVGIRTIIFQIRLRKIS